MDQVNNVCTHCSGNGDDAVISSIEGRTVDPQVEPVEKNQEIEKMKMEQPMGPDIVVGHEGVMRWGYEMNMWKNPTLLITIWKVLLLCAVVPAGLVFFMSLGTTSIMETLNIFIKVAILVTTILTTLMLIAYPIYAIASGGKYCVIFEMDEKGVKHIQMKKQFKKAQTFSMIGALAGLLLGSPTVTGANLLAGSKQSLYCHFSKVKEIIVDKKRHVIFVNEALIHNQVYVNSRNFAYVLEYIINHAKEAEVTYK